VPDEPPALDGVEHRYVNAGGLRMHVAEAGSGPPLVLLHGWPENWFAWRKLIGPLSETYRVICPDLRGFGWSEAPPRGYEKEQFATDVLALLDALDIERFRLAGHDWGGFAAFLIALRAPERVERLVVMSINHPWLRLEGGVGERLKGLLNTAYQPVLATPLLGPRVMRFPKLIARGLRYSSAAEDAWTDDELALIAGRWRDPARAQATSLVYRTFLLRELRPLLGGIYRDRRLTTPTLLLTGSEDPVTSAKLVSPGYEPYADDMRVEEIAGAGHWLPEERPQAVLERMRSFFAEAPEPV